MRLALLALLALAVPARAQHSTTMQRALKLLAVHDLANASIELQKVLDDMGGDTVETKQRAELAMGKTLFELGFHAAALEKFAAITQQGAAHRYFVASASWVLSILRVSPGPTPRSVLFAYAGTAALADPSNREIRDVFALELGREIAARQRPNIEAIEMLSRSRDPRAELELARVYLRAEDWERGVARAKAAARTPELAVEAARLVASWSHLHGHDARGALADLASTSAYARYQASRAKLDAELPNLASVPIAAFDAVMVPSACRGNWPDDIRPVAHRVLAEAKPVVEKLLALEDKTELEQELRKLRAGSQPGGDVVLAALDDPAMREQAAWLLEIQTELALFEKMSKGWQSSQIGANVLQELTVLQSIEAANTGALAHQRLQMLDGGLRTLEAVLANAPALSAGPGGKLAINDELCGAHGTAPTMVTRPTSGCAGCATGGASGWLGVLALAMLALRGHRRAHRSRDARARRG